VSAEWLLSAIIIAVCSPAFGHRDEQLRANNPRRASEPVEGQQ
jgi:hypothetical protein